MEAGSNTARAEAQGTPRLTARDVEDFCAGLRAKGIKAVVRTGARAQRPAQPLPASFDIKAARAELVALERRGPAPSEFKYSGEAAAEMAAWGEWMHTHQIAGLRFQIAQHEALQGVAA